MTTTSPLRDRLREALLNARRSQDRATTAALRGALSALENAEAVPVDTMPAAGAAEGARTGVGAADAPRRVLTEDDERAVLAEEIADLWRAKAAYDEAGEPARAADVVRAAEALESLGGNRPV